MNNEDPRDDFLARARGVRGDPEGPFVERSRQGGLERLTYHSLDLGNVDLTGACLRGVRLVECDLSDAILVDCDTRGTQLIRCNLSRTRLVSNRGFSRVQQCFGTGADWSDSLLESTPFIGVNFEGFSFENARMTRVRFTESELLDCKFAGATLDGLFSRDTAFVAPTGWSGPPDGADVDSSTVQRSTPELFEPTLS
ncbi:MAG: pentapeptide repeat-containing protein [Deltaproteobacteria bacterium]|nr:pentapeptide repeat-containing protein [Deltaproteobacteria bacterium]